MQHATRAIFLLEVGKILRVRILHVLWLVLGIKVEEVAKALVESLHRGQVFIAVTKVVLAKLPLR